MSIKIVKTILISITDYAYPHFLVGECKEIKEPCSSSKKIKNLVPGCLENRSAGSEHYGTINVHFQKQNYEVIYHSVIEIKNIFCTLGYIGMNLNKEHIAKERCMTRNSTKSIHLTGMIIIKGLPSPSAVSFRLHKS